MSSRGGTGEKSTALVLDIGGTQLRAAVVNRSGMILSSLSTTTDASGGPSAVISQILGLRDALPSEFVSKVTSAGIAVPGAVDFRSGHVHVAPALTGWTDIPFGRLAGAALGVPVSVEGDARAATIGEWKRGAGQGAKHICYVTVSTGIGGGAIIDGQVLRSTGNLAGQFGHMSVVEDSPVCFCGAVGCWEAVASGSGMGWVAARELATGKHSTSVLSGRTPSAKDIFAAAEAGDELGQELVEREARYLARGFVNLMHLFAPEKIIVGGGVGRRLEQMRTTIEREVALRAMPPYRKTALVQAELGDLAGVLGMAELVHGND